MPRIALLGFGNIGRTIAANLLKNSDPSYEISALIRTTNRPVSALANIAFHFDIADVLAWQPDLIVEAAGQAAVSEYAPVCLAEGISFVASSVGALADDHLFKKLATLAHRNKCRLIVPSGAVGGLDYLQSIKRFPDAKITYESRKPVAAWLPELEALGINVADIAEPLVLFSGPASEAAIKYPKNLNVAATLALAGIGMINTKVDVIVDPQARGNQHTVHAISAAGEFSMSILNSPSPDNPKTSWIVAENIVSTVGRYFSPCWIG
ncbi:aspartate dehydrogenase [Candidimonas sp. SYP-B2681]|uniref:aspartate dehydrogenase n=1 Tax=Candidimonas sp. SYP-B2681 TaxID=2497686 RepID=UPI000F885326|nr:aspartate dehydrogenase [Candidimonas sp. SYP-B2681]RTZ45568.1 aspartate dehydrogenase [Candidimonas sp. SYP-B2681]